MTVFNVADVLAYGIAGILMHRHLSQHPVFRLGIVGGTTRFRFDSLLLFLAGLFLIGVTIARFWPR